MFNVPIPGGTTAHAVGAVLIAVLLGPWAAVVCVSVALVIQALFFGDGGVLALGANTFNMALVMPFVGYGVYLLLTRNTSLTSRRRAIAAGLGGYVGLNVAALCAATELGLQPVLFHSANGTPLYAPYHLSTTIPAMALAHLTVAGFSEFVLTAGIVAYLQRANLPLLRINHSGIVDTDAELAPQSGRPALRWALIGIATMICSLAARAARARRCLRRGFAHRSQPAQVRLHAIPSGLQHYNGFWKHTLLGDYGFSSGRHANIGYVLSAIVGALAVGAVIFFFVGGRPVSDAATAGSPGDAA